MKIIIEIDSGVSKEFLLGFQELLGKLILLKETKIEVIESEKPKKRGRPPGSKTKNKLVKFKRKSKPTKPILPKTSAVIEYKICIQCGKYFDPKDDKDRFCSDTCKKVWNLIHKIEIPERKTDIIEHKKSKIEHTEAKYIPCKKYKPENPKKNYCDQPGEINI
jgi:predicted nucleic acid-binding Zn ribbon protein